MVLKMFSLIMAENSPFSPDFPDWKVFKIFPEFPDRWEPCLEKKTDYFSRTYSKSKSRISCSSKTSQICN